MTDANVLSSQSANHNHVVPFYIISDISTHTPLTGNNSTLTPVSKLRSTFQSTLSSLRAIQNGQQHQPSDYFNPRSPHRERQIMTCPLSCNSYFNPRSPHRERPAINSMLTINTKFQSTLPSQGATANIHIKFLCDLLFSTLSSKNSFTLSRFPQTIT